MEESIIEIFNRVSRELAQRSAISLQEMLERIDNAFSDQYYITVATGREWHIFNHGKPRTRKKWRAIFQRRLRRGDWDPHK